MGAREIPYRGLVSFSSRFSGIVGMMSPLTVVPLHLGDELFGVSQLDQSLSSYESICSGVQEKRFDGFVASVLDLCKVRVGLESVTPLSISPSPSSISVSCP